MKEFIEQLGINIAISIAGLFGSLLMIGKNAAQQWRTTIFSMISGVACANYITPLILDMTKMDVKYQVSVGFVLGFLGLRSVELISKKFIKDDKNGNNASDKSDS
jgi:bacteriorhodopsin